MASEKESFIIYKSFYEPIKILSDKQLGRLFRALFDYQIENKADVEPDILMAFSFFKNQMDIDERKYDKVVERNRSNGSKGGRPSKEKNPKNPVGFNKPKKPDNDNVNVNENVNDLKEKNLKKENPKKDFSFTLKQKIKFSNLSDEYQSKLKAKVESLIKENFYSLTYKDFKNSCLANGYAYADFNLAYQNWAKKHSPQKRNYTSNPNRKKLPTEYIQERLEERAREQAKRDEEYIETDVSYG